MEDNVLLKPTMVSRLPKFSARPPGYTSPLLNGTTQPMPSLQAKTNPPGRANGVVRISSPSVLNWKGNSNLNTSSNLRPVNEPERQQTLATREIKKPVSTISQLRRPAPSAAPSAAPPAPLLSSRAAPVQGSYSNKPRVSNGTCVPYRLGLRQLAAHPDLASGNLRHSLSRSSDSLKSLSQDKMARSLSFTHFKRLATPNATSVTRSLSFGKEKVRSKTLLTRPSPAATPKGAAAKLGEVDSVRLAPSGAGKKSLLPGAALSRPSSLSYRLTRPSLLKQQRQSAGCASDGSAEEPRAASHPQSNVEKVPASETTLEEAPGPEEMESVLRCSADYPEDMSLSSTSTSSLEHVDTGEERPDCSDWMVDGGEVLRLLSSPGERLVLRLSADDGVAPSQQGSTPSEAKLDSLMSDCVDWAGMRLSGVEDEFRLTSHCGEEAPSPDMGFPRCSSLNLSPSDSSGGTYMWDEEGLEPLGVSTHPCDSFDSDINSMDVLNDLDNLGSCDLEDDDLMLDVDLPEDRSFLSDVSCPECVEKVGGQGSLGERSRGWTGKDHVHNNNRGSAFQEINGHAGPGQDQVGLHLLPCPSPVDGDDSAGDCERPLLQEAAHDCSFIKAQLLQLKTLLQVEDEGLLQDAPISGAPSCQANEDSGVALQMEALLREAQELRQELRDKEKAILQLTQQMAASVQASRCPCQRRGAEGQSGCDKATQTPWRAEDPQILQPACSGSSKGRAQGGIAGASSAEEHRVHEKGPELETHQAHSLLSPDVTAAAAADVRAMPKLIQYNQLPGLLPGVVDSERPTSDLGVALPSDSRSKPNREPQAGPGQGTVGSQGSVPACTLAKGASAPTLRSIRTPTPIDSSHRKRGTEGVPRPRLSAAVPLRAKQLAPPSRLLACFSPEPPCPALAPSRLRGHGAGLSSREPISGMPTTRGLVLPTFSRLPKPKIQYFN